MYHLPLDLCKILATKSYSGKFHTLLIIWWLPSCFQQFPLYLFGNIIQSWWPQCGYISVTCTPPCLGKDQSSRRASRKILRIAEELGDNQFANICSKANRHSFLSGENHLFVLRNQCHRPACCVNELPMNKQNHTFSSIKTSYVLLETFAYTSDTDLGPVYIMVTNNRVTTRSSLGHHLRNTVNLKQF